MIYDYTGGKVFLLLCLVYFSRQDCKERKIDAFVCLCLCALELCIYMYLFLMGIRADYLSLLGGASIGLLLLLFGRCSREKIGYGDGLFFLLSGLGMGIKANAALLIISFFMAGVFSLAVFVHGIFRHKRIRDLSFPFLPFVLAGFIGMNL